MPLLAALLLLQPAAAQATPTELTIRIEGATRTLFEGPILSEGHGVQAASDSQVRPCDGTNGGAFPEPGPTPTAAAVDAMGLVGEDFDGRWYPGFDDYLITRWGPDAEDPAAAAFWGLLVDGTMIPVGGCQWRDASGDEVLWAYDVFGGRSLLRLAAAGDPAQPPQPPAPTVSVEVGEPLELVVESYTGGEGEEPETDPAAGVAVAPVLTETGSGYQTVEVASPAAVTTAADGTAAVSFPSAGWWRLKAQEEADHVRSNRLDVCVEPVAGGSCGPPPADAQLRVPPRYLGAVPPSGPPQSGVGGGSSAGGRGASADLRLGRIRCDRRTGTATMIAVVSGPGGLRLSGTGIRPFARWVTSTGSVALKVRPGARARQALRRSGQFATRLTVTFAAAAATATRHRGVVLRSR